MATGQGSVSGKQPPCSTVQTSITTAQLCCHAVYRECGSQTVDPNAPKFHPPAVPECLPASLCTSVHSAFLLITAALHLPLFYYAHVLQSGWWGIPWQWHPSAPSLLPTGSFTRSSRGEKQQRRWWPFPHALKEECSRRRVLKKRIKVKEITLLLCCSHNS